MVDIDFAAVVVSARDARVRICYLLLLNPNPSLES
jgi:hypothetical protein